MNQKELREILAPGGTVLYPTDTVWGLGCDATNEEACQKIEEIKGRGNNKSFIVLVDGFPMLERYIPKFHEVCYDIVDLSDEPITIIYPGAKGLAPSVLAEDGSVGIRVTKNPVCLNMIRSIRKPIVSTSANISGEPTPAEYEEINESIISRVDHIIHPNTPIQKKKPSKILKIGLGGEVKIIRG